MLKNTPPLTDASVAQLVEHLLAMQKVVGSKPITRSISPLTLD